MYMSSINFNILKGPVSRQRKICFIVDICYIVLQQKFEHESRNFIRNISYWSWRFATLQAVVHKKIFRIFLCSHKPSTSSSDISKILCQIVLNFFTVSLCWMHAHSSKTCFGRTTGLKVNIFIKRL